MRRDAIRLVGILVLIAAFSLLVYPTPYVYMQAGESGIPIKINRFTGKTTYFSQGSWVTGKETEQ